MPWPWPSSWPAWACLPHFVCLYIPPINYSIENKQGFYYIIVQPSASAFCQCQAMANAEAVAVAVANLTICTGMPTPFLMSLYTTNPLVNENKQGFHSITIQPLALAFW